MIDFNSASCKQTLGRKASEPIMGRFLKTSEPKLQPRDKTRQKVQTLEP